MENGNLSELEKMNNIQLKQYLAVNRNDDAKFSHALEILMKRRNPNAIRYSSNMTLEEIGKVIKDKLG